MQQKASNTITVYKPIANRHAFIRRPDLYEDKLGAGVPVLVLAQPYHVFHDSRDCVFLLALHINVMHEI